MGKGEKGLQSPEKAGHTWGGCVQAEQHWEGILGDRDHGARAQEGKDSVSEQQLLCWNRIVFVVMTSNWGQTASLILTFQSSPPPIPDLAESGPAGKSAGKAVDLACGWRGLASVHV